MKQLSEQQPGISVSYGAVLPNSILATTNLSDILQQAASRHTGITYCGYGGEDITNQSYSDLLHQAQCILGSLRDRGLQLQDKVILQLGNPRYFFSCLWGCFLGGFVPIPSGVERVDVDFEQSKLYRVWLSCGDRTLIISDTNKIEAALLVEDLLECEPDLNHHHGNLDDLALLLFTSGSTGKPKGVMLSARNLLASVYGMAKVNQLDSLDITLNWMPLEHIASLVMFHLTEVYLGCQQIQVQSESILQNPLQWLDLIDRHRVTASWSPNFAYSLVNEKLNNTLEHSWDLSCVRWMGNGAEAVVSKTSQQFLELLAPYGLSPAVLSPGYGMSETTSGICHSNNFYGNMNREFVEVGAPIPGVSLRIVNEDGDLVPEGVIGLLQVKGATVAAGYYQQPELNREVFTADGWFNTGDLGFLTAGRLTITGRQKDVIIINGVNYYSHEIEAVVEAIAGVTVSYTAACSVNSQQEQVAIFFHTLKQEEELRELINKIRHRVFTTVGVAPAYIIPVAKETIPKTAIGKIQRSQLGQRFAAGEFEETVRQVEDLFNSRNLSKLDLPHNAIASKLVTIWQEVLNLKTVSVNDSFFELGGNSLLLMQVLSKLTPEYNISATTLFQYPTISALANYLAKDIDSKAVQQGKRRGELRKTGNKDVAIIGMSCRFPGANNISEFWNNLCNGVESISFFENAEILASGVEEELLNNPNYVKASPILEDVEGFDADFWGYSPKEAQLLDPQQRLFLECAWESLEDAGYDPFNYQGDISLYGGAATNTYLLNNIYPNRHTIDDRDRLGVINLSSMGGFQVTTANDKDYLTTRTSYKLNLTGSSVNVQTACSTSLVTVHLACQSLINSECDLALAGGVSVHSPQKMGYLHSEGMILSTDGHCRAFDASASGTIFGSGAGMVVLKLLDKAITDGDRIYGVIKGSAVNNDGGTKVGYFAPNVDGQTRVVAEALAVADLPPESISYIEAHGTGTKLGDPIEVTALTQAYQHDTRKTGFCAVGSVKTNVGHLQMASGIVGLIKATLCLYHQKLVPSLHYTQPNPQIDLEDSPFYINTRLQEWTADNPRRAGVNSLGIGGTNAHVILEEFVTKEIKRSRLLAYLLTISAKTETALQELKQSYVDYLLSSDVELSDICFTSNVGRHHFDRRVGIVASNKLELADKLQQISPANSIQSNNKIAFLFTGQGSQYVGMGQELYSTQSVFRENCDRCLKILQLYLDTSLKDIIFTKGRTDRLALPVTRYPLPITPSTPYAKRYPLGAHPNTHIINQTQYTQPLLFTIEYALAQMWLSWGIEPDLVMGHSIGEYVAATIAGVFGLEDALKLVVNRGKLMQSLPEGAMLAVFGSLEEIDIASDKISVAADNGSHIVLSGLREEIDRVAKKLELQGIKTQRLNVSHAFHSTLMQPMVEEFKTVARSINYSLPQIPIISNLTGELAPPTIATADYWVEHILQPVQFAKSIEYLDRTQVDIFLEIGTKPTLIGMAKSILNNKLFLHSLDRQQQDWRQVLTTLSQLYTTGFNINWLEVTKNYNANKTSLPTYPWQRQRYWFDIPQEIVTSQLIKSDLNSDTIHPLLQKIVPTPLKQIIFQSDLHLDTTTWLQDHVVNNKIIFPGTAYLEIAIASGIYHYQTNQLLIEDVAIDLPLYLEKPETQIQLILDPTKPTWQIYSLDDEWQLHCSGKVSVLNRTIEAIALEEIKAEFLNHELDIVRHYQQCQQRGVNYGKSFQGIKQLWAKDECALGLIELPNNLDSSQYHFHPALLDSCLQILFAAITKPNTTYVPVGLDKLEIYSLPQDRVWSYLQIRQDNSQNKIILADVWLYNADGEIIAKLEGLKSQTVNSKPHWHDWLYQQEWIQQPITAKALSKNGSWLIFADSTGIGKQLATVLKSRQQRCHLVKYNPVFDNPQAFQDLLQQHSEVTGIIYLWSLDSVDNWEECKSYLYLIQAVIKLSHNPCLYLVTRNAQPVNNYELTSGIKYSCLWGMQLAIALEYPELLCVGIDLDPLSTDNEADFIFEEICAGEHEQAAYRHSQRYVSRLVRYNEMGRWGDGETGRLGDGKTGRRGDKKINLQLEVNNPGNLDSLEWKTVTRRQPLDNEIEIEVKATGLNFRDVMVALDLYPDKTKFLGLECAGVVTAVGKVTNFQIGDEVIAIAPFSFSKYVTVNSLLAISKPESFTFTEAATIPVIFLTAYYTLCYLAQLQPGEKVLIHAAAGGVGLAAIQIAQQLGAEVWATASKGKWELLESMGVTKIMNSRSLDFADEIMSATEGKGVDVVLNSLSGKFIPKSLSVLNEHGRFIEIGKQGIWSKSEVSRVKPNISYFVVDLWQITQKQPELIQQMLGKLHSKLHKRSQFTTGKLKSLPHTVFKSNRIIDAFRYMQQGKHQGKIVIEYDTQTKNLQFTPTGTYLITGGCGAIGLEVAQWLTTKGVTNIVLLGRNGVKPELQSKLQKLQHHSHITFIKADISSTSQLAKALLQIESTLPPLKGVIHCAGVTEDRAISNQDWNSFTKVLAPKVQGAWNLHELTQKYDLQSFILFSSASSLLGSAGQTNYCAANAFLDALAHARRSQGLPAIAINWGAWQNTGLAFDPKTTNSLKQKGIDSIEPSQAIAILEQLLSELPVQIGVIPIDWERYNNPVPSLDRNSIHFQIAKTDLKQQLIDADPSQRLERAIAQLSQQVGNILGIKNLEEIDLDLGFSHLGLDSLSSVELRNKVQSGYDLKLSVTAIFDYPSIKALAGYLLRSIFKIDIAYETTEEETNSLLNRVENITDEEAEALLLDELKDFDF